MTIDMTPSLGIVVASCDKYSDLWEPLFGEFFNYWPDCPYPIYLVANHKKFSDPRVTTLLAGDDIDWSSTITAALDQIRHSHVLFWIDDAFLAEQVHTARIENIFERMKELDGAFWRLRPNPMPKAKLDETTGVLAPEAAYRATLFPTIWKMSTLQQILRAGESAWSFELQGTERSRKLDGFYTVLDPVFAYWHGVERGVWIRPAARGLERRGYKLDFQYRRCMTRIENLALTYRLFKSWVLHQIPEQYRASALRIVQKCYKFLGLRHA